MKKRSKYLLNILLFSLFIGMTPVLALGFFSYTKASNEIQVKVNEGNNRILEQTQLRVEQVLQTVDTVTNQFIHSPLTVSVMELELKQEHYQEFYQLLDGMYKLQASSLGVFDVSLYNIEKGWFINKNGFYYEFDDAGRELLTSYKGMPKISHWAIDREPANEGDAASLQVKSVSLIKKMPIISSNPYGFLVSEIPIYEIHKLLSKNVTSGAMMILDADKSMVVFDAEDSTSRAFQVNEISDYMQTLTNPVGNFEAKIGKEDVMISYRQSAYNGWTYVSIVAIENVTRDSKAIGWFTWLTCLAICGLTLIIAWLGSRTIYRPIGRLYSTVLTTMGEEEAPAIDNEFESIEFRVRRLMQSKFRMASQLEGQTKLLEKYFLFKLFQGDLKRAEIEEGLAVHRLPADFEHAVVLAVEIDTIDGTRYSEQDKSLLLFALDNILNEIVPVERRIGPVVIQETVGVLVGGSGEIEENTFKEWVYQLAVKIQDTVRAYLDLHVSIGVSRTFRSPGGVPKALKEGLEALKYRLQLGPGVVLFIDDVQLSSNGSIQYPADTEKELVEAIKSMDERKALCTLHKWITEIVDMKMGCHHYEISLSRLLSEIIRIAQDTGVTWEALDDKDRSLYGELMFRKTAMDIENWFHSNVIAPLIRSLSEREQTKYRKISDEIVSMIHSEYESDLTLESCAMRVNYHPHYVSRVFSREMGIGFADYLSSYRLKKAKELLQETDLKVGEIASRLQYTNPQNFIRHFRKIVGRRRDSIELCSDDDIKSLCRTAYRGRLRFYENCERRILHVQRNQHRTRSNG